MIAFLKYLLEKPEANSRFVYLVQGLCAALAILIVAGFFVTAHTADQREGMVTMMSMLLGGSSLLSVGRMLTKKVAAPKADQPQEKE